MAGGDRATVTDASGAVLSAGCWPTGGYFSVQWPHSVAQGDHAIGHLSLDGGVTTFDMALNVTSGGAVTTTTPGFNVKRWAEKMSDAKMLLYRVGEQSARFDMTGANEALSSALRACVE